jgi:hypothetical protein
MFWNEIVNKSGMESWKGKGREDKRMYIYIYIYIYSINKRRGTKEMKERRN